MTTFLGASFWMNPYAIPPLLAALLNFVLVIWVYAQAPPGRIRQTFLIWNFNMGLWDLGIAGGYLLTDAHAALVWYVVMVTSVVRFIAPFFLQFVVAITEGWDAPENRRAIQAAYAAAFLFLILGLTMPSYFIRDVKNHYWGYY